MNSKLDQGPIVTALPFAVSKDWTASEYYKKSFEIVTAQLAEIISNFVEDKNSTPQPLDSPTPTAQRILKDDAFIPWKLLPAATLGQEIAMEAVEKSKLPELLKNAFTHHKSMPKLIDAATRAFSPWPQVWTKVMTPKGEKRLKVLSATLVSDEETAQSRLLLERVQLEGKKPVLFEEIAEYLGVID